ncbi:MAG: cation transporter [Spirochaetales bacterium]|nr:cation transporter [Spirochaetales bacterium]
MNRYRIALAEGWVSILVNLVLFAAKLTAGILSGSIAVMADAWHTLSDSFTSVIVLIGAKVSAKPADREHPFGHGRFELIASVIIGVLLGVTGFSFLTEAVERLSSRSGSSFPPFVIAVTAASVLIKEAGAQFAFWCYRKTGMKSLKADGAHHRSDALSSLVLLAGILAGQTFWWSDSVLAVFISFFIFHTAWDILKDGINPLLGEIPENDLVKEIQDLARKECSCCEHIHHLHIHTYGRHRELTFHMRLDPDMTIREGHQEATRLEKAILENLNIHATIHIEPSQYPGCR